MHSHNMAINPSETPTEYDILCYIICDTADRHNNINTRVNEWICYSKHEPVIYMYMY